MRLHTTPLLIVALSLVAAGCSDDGDSPTGPSTPAPTHTSTVVDGALSITVGTDKATYAFGETVLVTTSLTNVSDAAVEVDFLRGSPARYYNLNVSFRDDGGTTHRAYGGGENDVITLAPGQTLRESFEWDQTSRFDRRPVERGFFRVSTSATFEDEIRSGSTTSSSSSTEVAAGRVRVRTPPPRRAPDRSCARTGLSIVLSCPPR